MGVFQAAMAAKSRLRKIPVAVVAVGRKKIAAAVAARIDLDMARSAIWPCNAISVFIIFRDRLLRSAKALEKL
jgi:hypothetical protein